MENQETRKYVNRHIVDGIALRRVLRTFLLLISCILYVSAGFAESKKDVKIEAGGPFREGLAFAHVNGQPVYVDTNGVTQITLPEGFTYGLPFSDGYATITDQTWSKYSVSALNYMNDIEMNHMAQYAIIDRAGNCVIQPGIYSFIGTMSEGLCVAIEMQEKYNGTFYSVYLIDAFGNRKAEIDSGLFFGEKSKEFLNPYYVKVRNGILVTTRGFRKNVISNSGEHLGFIETGIGFTTLEGYQDYYVYARRNDTIEVYTLYNVSKEPNNDKTELFPLDILPKTETVRFLPGEGSKIASSLSGNNSVSTYTGYFAAYEMPSNVFSIFSVSGKRVGQVSDVIIKGGVQIDGNRWLVEMDNDYYSVIDINGNFLYEPKQFESRLSSYIGNDVFVQFVGKETTNFIDIYGEIIGVMKGLFRPTPIEYSDGILLCKYNNEYLFTDLNGKELVSNQESTKSVEGHIVYEGVDETDIIESSNNLGYDNDYLDDGFFEVDDIIDQNMNEYMERGEVAILPTVTENSKAAGDMQYKDSTEENAIIHPEAGKRVLQSIEKYMQLDELLKLFERENLKYYISENSNKGLYGLDENNRPIYYNEEYMCNIRIWFNNRDGVRIPSYVETYFFRDIESAGWINTSKREDIEMIFVSGVELLRELMNDFVPLFGPVTECYYYDRGQKDISLLGGYPDYLGIYRSIDSFDKSTDDLSVYHTCTMVFENGYELCIGLTNRNEKAFLFFDKNITRLELKLVIHSEV